MEKAIKRYWPIFVLPTFLSFIIGFIVPFVMGVGLSFTDFTTVTDAQFNGIKNYILALQDTVFQHAFWYTALFAVVSLLVINIIAFALALALTKKLRGTNLFRTVFFMPNLIGGIVLGYTWQAMLNAILAKWQTTIVADWHLGFIGLVMLINWQLMGYMMIIYIAGLQNVPPELVEAAQIDGASRWQVLRNVTLPMVMPSITICLFLTLANTFKMYDQNLALTAGAPLGNTEMAALNIVKTMYDKVSMEGIAQAKAVIFFLLVSIIAFLQLRATRSREVDQ